MKFPFVMCSAVEQMLLAAAVCVFSSSVVHANAVPEDLDALAELSLEQLMDVRITSASKFSQRASEAPASVSMLTAEDFKTYGWRTLADALANVRGFHVTFDRAYSHLGVRGFQPVGDFNSRVLLLIDGYRFNDNIYDQAQAGREFGLDVDLIERVEVVRGPSSSVYGGNALFAVVNVITKSADSIGGTQGGEVSGAIGSFGAKETRASFGKTLAGGARLVLSANQYKSDGPTLEFPGEASTGGAPVSDTDWEKGDGIFAKYDDRGFRMSLMHSDREKGVTGGLFGVPVDPRNFTGDSHSFIDASYTRAFGAIEWTGRVSYSEYQYAGDYYFDPAIISRDIAEGRWWNTELKGVTAFGRHKLVFGLEVQDNLRQDQTNFDVDPYTLYLDDRRQSRRTGLFVQEDFALNEHLTFSGGLRYDHYDYGDAEVNPRLGLIYRISDRTVGKLLYGTAFRPPNAFESHYSFSGLYVANPNLQPESITTYEAVLESTPADNLQLIATLFEYRIKNLLLPGVDPVTGLAQFQNLGKASAEGIEFEAAYAWESGTRLRTSYALQRSKDYMGNTLSNSPRQLAKLNVSVAFSEALRAGLEAQYVGSRHTEISAIPDYTLVNLTLGSAHPWKGVDLQATVRNMLDKHYFHPADLADPTRDLLEQNGRTILGKAVFRF
jgi:outer membrane receptor protein involved in Fe transport